MGLCFSAPPELLETPAPATTAGIGGLLAEGQTPAARVKPYAAAIPGVISQAPSRGLGFNSSFVKTNRRSDLVQPGGDPWRGDGTGVECFNDVLTVQPARCASGLVRTLNRKGGRPPRATGLLPSPRNGSPRGYPSSQRANPKFHRCVQYARRKLAARQATENGSLLRCAPTPIPIRQLEIRVRPHV
jgi:hypothetical protein